MVSLTGLGRDALLHILTDRAASQADRHRVATHLETYTDDEVVDAFTRIAFDPEENLKVRARVIEVFPHVSALVEVCVRALSDETPDIRFWAAYRLSQTWELDLSSALEPLDRMATFEHILPLHWGWHLDREALYPLEIIYAQQWPMCGAGEPTYSCRPGMWLISPQAEYDTFVARYRRWREDWSYMTLPHDPTTLTIDPDWLRHAIAKRWPGAEFNVRRPKPNTYALDWHITIYGKHVIGGLHRDLSTQVVTAQHDRYIYRFAAWYRRIIPSLQPLYLYEWADEAVELPLGARSIDVLDAVERVRTEREAESQRRLAELQAQDESENSSE